MCGRSWPIALPCVPDAQAGVECMGVKCKKCKKGAPTLTGAGAHPVMSLPAYSPAAGFFALGRAAATGAACSSGSVSM
jgi:hypothetical protein